MTLHEPGPSSIDAAAVTEAVSAALPGARVLAVEPLEAPEELDGGQALLLPGEPLLVRVELFDGSIRELVLHMAKAEPLSHEHRADRAFAMLLAHDGAQLIPRHAESIDVGALGLDGRFVSLRSTAEFYLLTEFVPGYAYADELRAVAQRGELIPQDIERTTELALCLAELHLRVSNALAYRRSVRDVFAGRHGVFGIIDGYPSDTPGVPRMVLERTERLCLPWRWKLRDYEHRAARIHGDFHPFNVVFSEGGVRLLEANRGCLGDPADDVICLAMNYLFFGLLWPGTWKPCFRRLWNAFFNSYLAETGDAELLEVAAPYLTARALALSHPGWYPSTPASVRERLLLLVEQVLGSARFDPASVEALFRDEEPHSVR